MTETSFSTTEPETSSGALLNESAIASLLSRKGEIRPAHRPWNTAASEDAISHYALGIGNVNPLWLDRTYASNSRFGTLIAPPTFEYSCGVTFGGGLPGVHSLFGGSDFRFLQPIRLNDAISSTISLEDIVEKQSRYSGRMLQQIERMVYTNQDGTVLTDATHWVMRIERDTARKRSNIKSSTSDRSPQTYSQEEIARIDSEYIKEVRRGQEIRYWDDVQVGETIPGVIKGPLRVTDILAYLMGTGSPYVRAHADNWDFRREHPSAYVLNPLGIPDVAERVHWESAMSNKIGVSGAYDYGQERPCWISHMLTNWMGDDGWLSRLKVQLAQFNLIGDTTTTGGEVTELFRDDDGTPTVRLAVWATNQVGDTTAKGEAWVQLPSRV